MSTNYEDDITYFNKLVGNTPFSFFKSVNTPVIVFDYYEKYTKELLNKICIQTNQKIDCEVEYLYNSEIDAFCFSQGVVNKIVFLEGTVLSIYRFASILSCVYRTILMKEEPKYQTIHKFDIRSVKDEEKMSSLSPTKNVATRYKRYAETNGFTIVWHCSYADHVNVEKARKRFNTSPANTIERADPSCDYESRPFQAGDLTELTYIMRI